MPKAYSGDLRVRVIEMVEAGVSRREAAEVFSLAGSTAVKWLQRWDVPKSQRGGPPSNSMSFSNATSVPARRHTATFGSPTSAKPRVIESANCVVTSLSPTLAGRVATL